jgi:hypothetical protein
MERDQAEEGQGNPTGYRLLPLAGGRLSEGVDLDDNAALLDLMGDSDPPPVSAHDRVTAR